MGVTGRRWRQAGDAPTLSRRPPRWPLTPDDQPSSGTDPHIAPSKDDTRRPLTSTGLLLDPFIINEAWICEVFPSRSDGICYVPTICDVCYTVCPMDSCHKNVLWLITSYIWKICVLYKCQFNYGRLIWIDVNQLCFQCIARDCFRGRHLTSTFYK